MALPDSGAISLGDVRDEFGGTNPVSLGDYYGTASGVPASGQISLSDFYGKSNLPSGFFPATKVGDVYVWTGSIQMASQEER